MTPVGLPDLSKLTAEEKVQLLALLEELERRRSRRLLFDLYPDEGPLRRELYPKHMEFFWAGHAFRERCAMAANRVGKALQHGTRVATPSGWRTIESLRVGDQVIAMDGTPTAVVGVYPQGEKPLYRLTFDAGQQVVCCGEHLWRVLPPAARYGYRRSHGKTEQNPRAGRWEVLDTHTLAERYRTPPGPRQRFVVPSTEAWQLPEQDLPLDPYLIGLLLGDGGLTADTPTFTTADPELLDALRSLLPADVQTTPTSNPYGFRLSVPGAAKGQNKLTTLLREMLLLGSNSYDKAIPGQYLNASAEQRLALLQGLMDTDGSILTNGAMEFSSASADLAKAVEHLVISLGGRAISEPRETSFTHHGVRKVGAQSWRVRIRMSQCPFRLTRKVERFAKLRHERTYNRVLRAIEPAGVGLATCIEVAHPSHCFVIEHGIVTHNSFGMGGYEVALHLTGEYPAWWNGRRFERPVQAWAAGKTNETTRDIVQQILCGDLVRAGPVRSFTGTGLIPGDSLGPVTWKQGVPDLADTIQVKHKSGGWSKLGLKSYQQGRGSFEGTAKDVIWLDEEPPMDIYGECVMRTATTNGIVLMTFTPLEGMSDVVLSFLPGGKIPGVDDAAG